MADIEITDDLGKLVPEVKIDLAHPSSLFKYAKSELLHLAVAPDFMRIAPQPLAIAAPDPLSFELNVGHDFQLGNIKPEITLGPSFEATLRANATSGAESFRGRPFPCSLERAPEDRLCFARYGSSLDLGVSGSSGDLTFGFDANGTMSLEYWKAFPLGLANQPLAKPPVR